MTFVDTSAIYALLDRDDQNHPSARTRWTALLESAQDLLTTNYFVVEVCALAQHRLGLHAVRAIQEPAMRINWIDEATHTLAMATLLAARRRKLSLVDCAGFAAMRQAGARTFFAFDQHFREEGFGVPR